MAISTYRTFLMIKEESGSNWEKLLDITESPQIGGPPESIEVTTLSDSMKKFIAGIQNSEPMAFPFNYEKADYQKLVALEGKEREYAVWFGGTGDGSSLTPTGANGKFKFKGTMSVYVEGAGVNAAHKMRGTILPTSIVEFE